MVNWRTFKINRKLDDGKYYNLLYVDGEIEWKSGVAEIIFVFRSHNFQVGDCIAVDIDKTRNLDYAFASTYVNDNDMIRKLSSSTDMIIGSTIITREHGLATARTLDAMVDQSGGTKEYTASIEVQDNQGRPVKFSISSKKAN